MRVRNGLQRRRAGIMWLTLLGMVLCLVVVFFAFIGSGADKPLILGIVGGVWALLLANMAFWLHRLMNRYPDTLRAEVRSCHMWIKRVLLLVFFFAFLYFPANYSLDDLRAIHINAYPLIKNGFIPENRSTLLPLFLIPVVPSVVIAVIYLKPKAALSVVTTALITLINYPIITAMTYGVIFYSGIAMAFAPFVGMFVMIVLLIRGRRKLNSILRGVA